MEVSVAFVSVVVARIWVRMRAAICHAFGTIVFASSRSNEAGTGGTPSSSNRSSAKIRNAARM